MHRKKVDFLFILKTLIIELIFLSTGKKIVTSWTRLENTANAGATEIVLTHPVDWVAGDVVVIATTNHRHRQQETEQHTIASVSADKRTLTLEQPLTYSHLGVTGNYGGQDIEFRAEVGLLSRTITFRGTVDDQWNDPIEQCPDGFDTGLQSYFIFTYNAL